MTCDSRTSQALIDALFTSGSMGLCLFDREGTVLSVEGSASIWAPPVGASIEEGALFVGMREAFDALSKSGESMLLSGVSIGSGDGRALDVRVLWVEPLSQFAAISSTATERNQLQLQVSQFIRDNRLLEEQVARQREKIAEQAALMALFIRHVPAAMAMVDSNLEPMMLSQRWIEEFGDPSLEGDPDVFGSPLRMPNIEAAIRLAMDTGVTSSRVEKIARRGSTVWKRWEQTPWRRADRSIGGSILFIEDVTEEVLKSRSLLVHSGELERLNAAVRMFGDAITNDMRAPLRRIAAAARAARVADADSRERLGEIRAAAANMNGMIDGIQSYLDLMSHEMSLEPVDVADAVEQAFEELRPDIEAAGARIVLHPTLVVNADRELLVRMLRNLVDNALKYGGGAPTITIDCQDEDDWVIVGVTDDGPGLPVHLHNRAFQPFSRLDASVAAPGNGVGLTECRKIVELHGGTIAIDPDYELGLRVLINLPRKPTAVGLPPV